MLYICSYFTILLHFAYPIVLRHSLFLDFTPPPNLFYMQHIINKLPFEPNIIDDFPTTNGEPRIPHIIHQVYKDDHIPTELAPLVKSFFDNNPSWKYYFWTDISSRQLIKQRHAELLTVWDNIEIGIFKGDIMRIVALYEFGGAYFDLDVLNHRSLDRVTRKYSCIIPTEAFEHNVFLYNTEIIMTNAIIFCRAKHPFLKMALNEFRTIRQNPGLEQLLGLTGPGLITRLYLDYNNRTTSDYLQKGLPGTTTTNSSTDRTSNSSPYFFKSSLPVDDNDAIYIPNSKYFSDNLDTALQLRRFVNICKDASTNSVLVQRACAQIDRFGFFRRTDTFAFTTHKYVHLWHRGPPIHTTAIIDIVPTRIIFN